MGVAEVVTILRVRVLARLSVIDPSRRSAARLAQQPQMAPPVS